MSDIPINLSTEEILEREKKAKLDKALEKSEDRDFWNDLATEVNNKLLEQAHKEGIIETVETLTAQELLKKDFPETVWLVKNLIPSEGFIALTGSPASYKSFLCQHLAICLATNKPFLGYFEITPGAVLIIDKENPLSLLKERLIKLGLTNGANIYFLKNPDHFKLTDKSQLNFLIDFIKEKEIRLLIIDSFVHIHKGDENDSTAIATTFEILKKFPCAILFIHHHRKTIKFFTGTPLESIRGSSDIAAEVESHIAVDQVSNGIRIAQYKNRRGELTKPFLVTPIITQDLITFKYNGEIEEEESKVEQAIVLIRELLLIRKEIARKELIEQFSEQLSRMTIDRAIKKLEKDNEISTYTIGKYKYLKLKNNVTQDDDSLSNVDLSPLEQSILQEAE